MARPTAPETLLPDTAFAVVANVARPTCPVTFAPAMFDSPTPLPVIVPDAVMLVTLPKLPV